MTDKELVEMNMLSYSKGVHSAIFTLGDVSMARRLARLTAQMAFYLHPDLRDKQDIMRWTL